jgi:C-terminal processing protease CtpA/Prc
VVVDTRWNGGGWLHNDLAVLLSGKEYVRFTPRGRYIGSEPFSQWHKPSVMLVSEANYSDAHGSPYTYKTLEIGKLVGAPVPGTMTAVWWETQIDPSIIFGIPQVTNSDLNGNALENKQLNPDITVYNDPADELSGKDAQLEAAVKALLK